jgi:hypothetical protein
MSILFHIFPLINVDFIRFVSDFPGKTPLFTKIPCKLLYFPTISPKFFKIPIYSNPTRGHLQGLKTEKIFGKPLYRPYKVKRASRQKEIILPYVYKTGLNKWEKRVCLAVPRKITLVRTVQDKLFFIERPLKRGLPTTDGW